MKAYIDSKRARRRFTYNPPTAALSQPIIIGGNGMRREDRRCRPDEGQMQHRKPRSWKAYRPAQRKLIWI